MEEYKSKRLTSPADLTSMSKSDYSYEDFIYSVTLKKESADGKLFTLVFGLDDESELESYYSLSVDFEHQQIRIGDETNEAIKTVEYTLNDDTNYKVNLIVNSGVAKVYVNDSVSAALVYDLPAYSEGKMANNLESSNLDYSKESLMSLTTAEGDYYIGGYTVNKVVNLSDNNYRLTSEQYSIDEGVITIDRDYLNTLETNTDYLFRAVTPVTDFDFYVSTELVGASIRSAVDKYYRGDDVRIEVSSNATVKKALIDGSEVSFSQKDDLVTIASNDLSSIGSGSHTVKLFTDKGRPETKFSLYEVVEVLPEVKPAVNHTFFYVDIAIFASLILGYLGFSIFKKRAK